MGAVAAAEDWTGSLVVLSLVSLILGCTDGGLALRLGERFIVSTV